jgi:hypothetical protein
MVASLDTSLVASLDVFLVVSLDMPLVASLFMSLVALVPPATPVQRRCRQGHTLSRRLRPIIVIASQAHPKEESGAGAWAAAVGSRERDWTGERSDATRTAHKEERAAGGSAAEVVVLEVGAS